MKLPKWFEQFLFAVGFHIKSGMNYYDLVNNEGEYRQR